MDHAKYHATLPCVFFFFHKLDIIPNSPKVQKPTFKLGWLGIGIKANPLYLTIS